MNWPLVAGVGSHFGDDCAGWRMVQRLEQLGYPSDRLQCVRHPSALLDCMRPAETLIVCDACQGSGVAGSIHHWRWPNPIFRTLSFPGTHEMGLKDVLDLADVLQIRPRQVDIWAIEGAGWNMVAATPAMITLAAAAAAEDIWSFVTHA